MTVNNINKAVNILTPCAPLSRQPCIRKFLQARTFLVLCFFFLFPCISHKQSHIHIRIYIWMWATTLSEAHPPKGTPQKTLHPSSFETSWDHSLSTRDLPPLFIHHVPLYHWSMLELGMPISHSYQDGQFWSFSSAFTSPALRHCTNR